jgi:A1 cistron-splicing factor AAR2
MRYDPKTENIDYLPGSDSGSGSSGVISDDSLKALDKELAAYPFEGLGVWRSVLTQVTPGLVEKVLGERKEGRLDGMTGVRGIEEEDTRLNTRSGTIEKEGKLVFPIVDPKRSWRDGAVGEEITKYSKDKSWMLGEVVKAEAGGESSSGR